MFHKGIFKTFKMLQNCVHPSLINYFILKIETFRHFKFRISDDLIIFITEISLVRWRVPPARCRAAGRRIWASWTRCRWRSCAPRAASSAARCRIVLSEARAVAGGTIIITVPSPFPCSVLILFIYSYFDGANNKIWQVCAPARSRHLRRRESAALECRQGSGRTFPPCNNTHYRYYLDIHISSSRYLDISTLQTMWICVNVNVYCWSYV